MEISSLTDTATLEVKTGGSVGAAIQYGPVESPHFYMRAKAAPDAAIGELEELSLSGDVETFRVTKRPSPGNIQDYLGDVSLFGNATVGRIPDPALLTQVVPTSPADDTTYHPNIATADSGALRTPKLYPRTVVKDCLIGGHVFASDHHVLAPAEESCTVEFAEFMLPGESLEDARIAVTIRGDLDDPGELVESLSLIHI